MVGEQVQAKEEEGSARDKLDDSEEERVANDDDELFGLDNGSPRRNIGPVLDRWKPLKQNSSRVRNTTNVGERSFMTNEEVGVHNINKEHNSDELDFDVDSDEGVVNVGPKFSKYKPEDMKKNFKFKLGMEFCSLKDFKHALIEHSVLNGKEVKFVKNDHKRVRVVCRKNMVF